MNRTRTATGPPRGEEMNRSKCSALLPTPTDPNTLYKTHSLRWLAQIVSQIIKAMLWEVEFKREGTSSRAEFAALVVEVEATDPTS